MPLYAIAFIVSVVAIIAAGVAGNRSSLHERLAKKWRSYPHDDFAKETKHLLRENTYQTISGLFVLTAIALWICGIVLFFVR